MSRMPRWRQPQHDNVPRETRRWAVAVIVLIMSLGIYGVERWLRTSDAAIIGQAFVVDGDTLTISNTRIRLVDIDAPELDQTCLDAQSRDWSCGRQASSQLRSLVRGRDLTCRKASLDQYGRTLATCALPDGTDLNAWMVEQGWAVTSGYAEVYGRQQAAAKAAGRGLWAGSFTPPREWRRQHPRSDGNQKH